VDQRILILNSIKKSVDRLGYRLLCTDPELSYSFDLVLRLKEKILLIKITPNVGLLTEEVSNALIALAKYTNAYPLIISLYNRNEKIEDGVVYTRHSLPVVSPSTFISYIENEEEPLVKAGPGGFYVNLDSEKLRKIREEKMLSLGDIANAVGTSRRAVLMYESGMSASVDTALKMEEFLGEEIMSRTSFLWKMEEENIAPAYKKMREFERLVNFEIQRKGFSIYPFKKSIMNFLMEDSDSLFLGGIEEETMRINRRMEYMRKLSEMMERESFIIIKSSKNKIIQKDIPIIYYSELEEFQDKEEMKEVIRERRII